MEIINAARIMRAALLIIFELGFCVSLPMEHYRMTPSFLPTFAKVASPSSKSFLEWEAEIMTRILALPFGTVGKPIAIANTPSSKSSRLNC